MEQSGSPRFLESPSVPLPCSKTPAAPWLPLPLNNHDFAPATLITKAAALFIFSRLIHTALILAVYASRFGFPYTGKTRFRSGSSPYRVGFEPTGLHWRISIRLRIAFYSDAPGLAWRQSVRRSMFDVRHFIPAPMINGTANLRLPGPEDQVLMMQ